MAVVDITGVHGATGPATAARTAARVCVFGTGATQAAGALHATSAAPVEALQAHDVSAALREAAARFPGVDLVLLRAGTALPPYWFERLTRALELPDVLVAAPLDNIDAQRAPLPAGMTSDADPAVIDAACFASGARQVLDWATFSPLLSIWSGALLTSIAAQEELRDKVHNGTLSQPLPGRCVLLDHLYVADPRRPLRGPQPHAPGADPVPPSALGALREQVGAATIQAAQGFYPGLDAKPVVLHILHGWGGGAERFVRDFADADTARHHLVLIARGNSPRRRYGETLELRDAAMARPPLRTLALGNAIASTAFEHPLYRAFLHDVIADFGVDAVFVSSLIGHSLDALRTGLPTTLAGHDFYPLWPLLHRDFGDAALPFDAAQRAADLAGARDFEFAERDPAFWQALRDAYVAAVRAAQASIVTPSRSMQANLRRLAPELSTLPQCVIPHGLRPMPGVTAWQPPQRERLRLLVPGRVRRGKGAELLRRALPRLRGHAEIFLLGAGAEGMEFFGERDVHIVLDYRREDLPALVARIAPDAALLLPTVAETFSYTLSELTSLGVPTIATRIGALAERIHDGVDGFLTAADADAVIATVQRLRRERGALAAARSQLRKVPSRDTAQMVADYADVLPPVAHEASRYRLRDATPQRILASTLAGELGDARRGAIALRREIATQQRELEQRAEWAIGLDRELQRTGKALLRTQKELDERSEWAAQLDAELGDTRRERDELRHERALILRSWSWRMTKPLRFALRQLRGLRTRLAFAAGRVRTAVHRARGSLVHRGLIGTLKRAATELRRKGIDAPALIVPEPSEAFAPFALPTSATPRVSIVMPVYNKIAYTAACLRSLAEHAGSIAFEVIVVDDCSSDATPKRLAQIGGVRTLRNAQNLGFVGSCNAGAEIANGEFVLFLNNDTVVTAGWLEALLRCFDEEADCGLVGAKLVYPDGRLQEAGGIVFRDGSGWNYGRFDDPADPRYNFRREVDYCSGAAVLLRRDLLQQLGGFDARYAPAYYEDTDLAFAVRAAGKRVLIEPRAVVVHFEGITAGTDTAGSGMKRFQPINREKFLEKWKKELSLQPVPVHDAAGADLAATWRARGRVLIVDACTPMPDHDSGSLRMVNLMRLLRQLGYAVSFMSENRMHDGRYTEALQALGIEALYHPYVSSPIAWLRARGHALDAIVLSRHYVAANYIGLARLYAPRAKLIFDTVDLHYLREQRAAELDGNAELARQAARSRTQELKLMRECDVTLVVSDVEKTLLAREVPGVRVEILSNVHEIYGCRRGFDARKDLVFVGGFQHPPNIDAVIWFVREVFPHVRAVLPDVVFHIIGSKAPPEITALAHDGVVVHGFVENLEPFMDGCRISVAPLRYGAGVKGKVNMAMSYGLPVVATAAAVEGMHVRAGNDVSDPDVLVADAPADFAAAIVRLYGDKALWNALSRNGLENVRRHFSFDAARDVLQQLFAMRSGTR
jgi:GT2 family glycosyltransferase/glycosyltransferase involved in cell wall biosynthesis